MFCTPSQTGDGCSAENIIRGQAVVTVPPGTISFIDLPRPPESQSDFLKLQVRTLEKAAAVVGLEDCACFQVLTWHLAVLIRHHGNSLSGIHEAEKI